MWQKPALRYSPDRFSRYARDLSKAVDAMRFRITEPTFFWGQDRKVGEIMEAPTGPYRNFATGGGLQRIAQFVEMPDEIKQTIIDAAQAALPAAQGLSQNALNPVVVPIEPPKPMATAAKAPKANPLAARVRALTARRAKFQDFAAGLLETGEKHMNDMEEQGPVILQRAVDNAKDEIDAIVDLDDAMKQFAASNGGDPL